MGATDPGTISLLLSRWRDGEQECLRELIPLVETELVRIAHRQLRNERRDHTLQTTALVNEAYLRLAGGVRPTCRHRVEFFALAATLMRHILVDHARSLRRDRRGGGAPHVALESQVAFVPARPDELLALDEALTALAAIDVRQARVVELRYFGGMSVEEVAEAVGIHPNSVIRDWALAKAWLKRRLCGATSYGSRTLG
jgi:RNA polymerase sigma-70 factor, ECF subfamily